MSSQPTTPNPMPSQPNTPNGHLLPSGDGTHGNGHLLPSGDGTPNGHFLPSNDGAQGSSSLSSFIYEPPLLASTTPWSTSASSSTTRAGSVSEAMVDASFLNSFGSLRLDDGLALDFHGNAVESLGRSFYPRSVLLDEERRLMAALQQNHLWAGNLPASLYGGDLANDLQFTGNSIPYIEQPIAQEALLLPNQNGVFGRNLGLDSSNNAHPLSQCDFPTFPLPPEVEEFNRLIMQAGRLQELETRRMRPQFALQGNLTDFIGSSTYNLARGEESCFYLKRKVLMGLSHDLNSIINGSFSYLSEIVMDSNGSNIIQELLRVSTEEQIKKIVVALIQSPVGLVRISVDVHGTKVVQKLIDKIVRNPPLISMVINSLRDGFLELVKDVNGSRVLKRCLQVFSHEDKKGLLIAAIRYCDRIAKLQHGCFFLQSCIQYSIGEHQEHLVDKIVDNGLDFAQDTFGNYLVQFVLERGIPSANTKLAFKFRGHYVNLSKQKFSSNVVEKCLIYFEEDDRTWIVYEILQVSPFNQLLEHHFANYVILCALENSEGHAHAALVRAILPYRADLQASPYCKRIFSKISSGRR